MSLSAKSKQTLLDTLYYGETTQFTSIKSLHDAVKSRGITYKEVRDFIQNQESNQLFKKPKKIKHYYPIFGEHRYQILQIDIADMSNIAKANKNYNYLFVAIDVFSRMLFVIPLKNKKTQTIIDAATEILDDTEPSMLNADNGSEFTSAEFKKLLKDRGIDIQYAQVGDHFKLGLIDRVIRTLREKINKYMEMHNTTNYIDILSKIVQNYNLAYHSGIKKAPSEVEDDDRDVLNIYSDKYSLAKKQETIFQVGDNVRYIINLKQFEKHSLPRFSKTIHQIKSKVGLHSYLLDNGQVKKYYELQQVQNAHRINTPDTGPSREEMIRDRRVSRKLNKEGIDISAMISHRLRPRK